MGSRLALHELLEAVEGVKQAYFQPPPSKVMEYPAIVYSQDGEDAEYADNELYRHKKRYLVVVIDRDPDSSIPDRVRRLPYASFSRKYVVDNLNHFAFSIFF